MNEINEIDERYKNGKIYHLISGSGKIYIGSTIQDLQYRERVHRSEWKYKIGNCSSRFIYDEGGVEIKLIENYPCNNLYELKKRERWFIENTDCVNKQIPLRSYKEYYEQYKERILEQNRQWKDDNKEYLKEYRQELYDNNKEQINNNRRERYKTDHEHRNRIREYNNEKIKCECGCYISRQNMNRHKETDKHKRIINNR
jgi:hypothetical protein